MEYRSDLLSFLQCVYIYIYLFQCQIFVSLNVECLIVVLTCQALVDAPDMVRGQVNFKRLSLTDIKIDIPRVPKKKSLIAAMEAAGNTISSCIECKSISAFQIGFYFPVYSTNDEKYWNCRCKEQVGEQFMGQEADCAEKKSFSQ